MKQNVFTLLLEGLEPKTLAYLIRDMANALEDWGYYPETAPDTMTQQAFETLFKLAWQHARQRIEDFESLLEEVRQEQDTEAWSRGRDRQEMQNWLSDYE